MQNFKLKNLQIVILISLIYLFCFLNNKILPFSDSPNHIAEAFLYKNLNDIKPTIIDNYYELNFNVFTPNILHTVLTSYFKDVESGNQIFYTIYLILFIVFTYRLIKLVNGNLIFLFLSFLLIFNFNVMWGFTGYVFGIAIILLYLEIMMHYINSESFTLLLALILISIISYYSNVQIFLFEIEIVIFTFILLRTVKLNHRIYLLLSLLPGLILLLYWIISSKSFSSDESTISFLFSYYSTEYFPELPRRIYRLFWLDNFRLFENPYGRIVGIIFILPVIYLFVKRIFQLIKGGWITLKDFLINDNYKNILIIFLLSSAINYILLPDRLPGQSFLYQRFSVFFIIGIIFFISFSLKNISKILSMLLIILSLTHSFLWLNYFMEFGEAVKPFESVLKDNKFLNEKLLGYIVEANSFRGFGVFSNFLNYHIIWNKGVTPTEITNYRFRIVKLKIKLPHKTVVENHFNRQDIENLIRTNKLMDYIICYGSHIKEKLAKSSLVEIVDQKDEWILVKPLNP